MLPLKICIVVVTTLWLITITSTDSANSTTVDKEGSSDGGTNRCLNCSTAPPSAASIYPVYGAPPPPAGPAQANCPPSAPVVQCCEQRPSPQYPPLYGYPPPYYYPGASPPTSSLCPFGGLFFMNCVMMLLVFHVY